MEHILSTICEGKEGEVSEALAAFIDKNKGNFQLGVASETRQTFIRTLLDHLDGSTPRPWSLKTQSLALASLRIVSREREGTHFLISRKGLGILASCAQLSSSSSEAGLLGGLELPSAEQVEVVVEAVKCLCNLVLNNHDLTTICTEIGCLKSLSTRLSHLGQPNLASFHNLVFFDLRFLFLLTACGVQERVSFRDNYNGIPLLLHLTDSILFNAHRPSLSNTAPTGTTVETTNQATPTSDPAQGQPPASQPSTDGTSLSWETTWNLPSPVNEDTCALLCEILKVLFNQTLHWKKDGTYTESELQLFTKMVLLVRMLLLSVPPNHTPSCLQLLIHCAEVLVNVPESCAPVILLSPEVAVMPHYSGLISSLDNSRLHRCDLDVVYEGFNVAAVLALLNVLNLKLGPPVDSKGLSSVITALALLSRGDRVVRRFLKSEILPPIKNVGDIPEHGTTLKSKVVGLMTAGTHGAEQVSAELMFVLCKGNADKLIRHTGYGNAAGLLLSRGLLGGGVSAEQANYSSDSEADQDAANVDLMTGGPSKPSEPSPLSKMSPEEVERETEELHNLFAKLNDGGIIQVLDSSGRPMQMPGHGPQRSPFPSSSSSSSLDD